MKRIRDVLALPILAALWSARSHDSNWVDPLSKGETARCQGQSAGGVCWEMHNDGDCGGIYRTLNIQAKNGQVLTARVLDGQILLDRTSNPPRFRVSQPTLYETSSHYPYGRPGSWTLEYTSEGYRWK